VTNGLSILIINGVLEPQST